MSKSRWIFCFSFVVWLSASIAGMTVLWNHEARPGIAAAAPAHWPDPSHLARKVSRSTMLVWIHPRCPCSRATIGQLQRLLVHLPGDTDCQVVLARPAACDADFIASDLTRSIRQMSGVRVVVDDAGREASRFGVATSGQVLLYGKEGELLFAGGITPGRGHEGDSVGAATLREIFRRDPTAGRDSRETRSESLATDCPRCSVFGCGLFESPPDQSESP